jgi:CheY-like chemotaxis protein
LLNHGVLTGLPAIQVKSLVFDDERAIRFWPAELLESGGHEVREAEHATASLDAGQITYCRVKW